mgnify:CR=1 FL=1
MWNSMGSAWNGFSIWQGQTDWTVWLYSQTLANKKSLERFRLSGQAGAIGFSKPLWWSGWREGKRPEILQLLSPESGVSLVFIAVVDALEEYFPAVHRIGESIFQQKLQLRIPDRTALHCQKIVLPVHQAPSIAIDKF